MLREAAAEAEEDEDVLLPEYADLLSELLGDEAFLRRLAGHLAPGSGPDEAWQRPDDGPAEAWLVKEMSEYLQCALPAGPCPPPLLGLFVACFRGALEVDAYPPSDDTILMAEVLAQHCAEAPEVPAVVVEVGCGSGLLSAAAARALAARLGAAGGAGDTLRGVSMLATDLSAAAADLSARIVGRELAEVGAPELYSFRAVRDRFCEGSVREGAVREGSVDLLFFNPPYVPSPEEELEDQPAGTLLPGALVACSGGARGRSVMDEFLRCCARPLLRPGGVCFLCGVEENAPDQLLEMAREELGLRGELVRRGVRCGEEALWVARLWKDP